MIEKSYGIVVGSPSNKVFARCLQHRPGKSRKIDKARINGGFIDVHVRRLTALRTLPSYKNLICFYSFAWFSGGVRKRTSHEAKRVYIFFDQEIFAAVCFFLWESSRLFQLTDPCTFCKEIVDERQELPSCGHPVPSPFSSGNLVGRGQLRDG